MDHIPVAFIESLLNDLTILNDVIEYTRLSGSYALHAKQLKEKGHHKSLVIENGAFGGFNYYNQENYELDSQVALSLCPKFRVLNYVRFIDDDRETRTGNKNWKKCLDNFLKEPRMLGLHINGSSFDLEWVKICSAWKSLQQVVIYSELNESVLQLLRNLLKQKQLICLTIAGDDYGIKEAQLYGTFLQQKQFRQLSFEVWNKAVKDQLMLLASEDIEKFVGKTIAWFCKATLHNHFFTCQERIHKRWLSYSKGDVVAIYYNNAATSETTVEEFMEGVHQSTITFELRDPNAQVTDEPQIAWSSQETSEAPHFYSFLLSCLWVFYCLFVHFLSYFH
ncbi:hypothetical protein L596_017496 [Steinernema carpocapsae]|uniref:Uncharacterized protein n=1 Tax=Steinernema carpocapsae TaxID=34508 RepID=A0A4U5N2I9_STECR|nr:hypothetical protein L596_017496 [Steinernema carpocapsae]